jgi:hypothetical protein
VRLCAVILNDNYSKDRYCGKAQTITGEYVDQYKKEETDKYEEEKKEYTKKVEEKKEYVKKEVKTSTLSSAMKMRIDSVIENFVGKLEDK